MTWKYLRVYLTTGESSVKANDVFFGQALTRLRERFKIPRADLARRMGISTNYLGMVEAGKRCLSQEKREKLGQILAIPSWVLETFATPPVSAARDDTQERFLNTIAQTIEAYLLGHEERLKGLRDPERNP